MALVLGSTAIIAGGVGFIYPEIVKPLAGGASASRKGQASPLKHQAGMPVNSDDFEN